MKKRFKVLQAFFLYLFYNKHKVYNKSCESWFLFQINKHKNYEHKKLFISSHGKSTCWKYDLVTQTKEKICFLNIHNVVFFFYYLISYVV